MIGSRIEHDSGGRTAAPTESPQRPADPVKGYRWWRVAADIGGAPAVRPALLGGGAAAVWPAPLTVTPCLGNSHEGYCTCGLHATAQAIGKAKGFGSFVASGKVRVVATGTGDNDRPIAVLEIAGPLRVLAWCEGSQEGLVQDNCIGRPEWVVGSSSAVAAFCSRHFHKLPRRVRSRHQRFGRFAASAITGLGARYGVKVTLDDARVLADTTQRPSPPEQHTSGKPHSAGTKLIPPTHARGVH